MPNFFFSKYSNYSPDQIIDDYYKKAIKYFLEKAPNDLTKDRISRILYYGGFDDFSVNTDMMSKDNPYEESKRRIFYAGLLLADHRMFYTLVNNKINLFHGTNSNSLASILKDGMYSESEMLKNGQTIVTGEGSPFNPRTFISFTDQIHLALDYSMNKPYSQAENENSYGVFIGISSDDLDKDNNEIETVWVRSITPEIGIIKHLPKNYIKFIAVPQKHIQEVQNIINENGLDQIIIYPAEGIINAAIEADMSTVGFTRYSSDCLEIHGYNKYPKFFGKKDLKETANERKTSGIKQIFQKLKSTLKIKQTIKGEEYGKSRD